MAQSIVGGIEGGATHSSCVLLNTAGEIVAAVKGPGTNHHLTGMEECRQRIVNMINNAKSQANLDQSTPLDALGLSLSGCETEETNQILVDGLKELYPNLSKNYAVGSDTEGSIATTSNVGGVTCIAGTGSNTLLINPDGKRIQCGGWGYLLGDEGSAWRIALSSVKYCFDDMDNFKKAPYPITTIWNEVKSHFNIETQPDILTSFYSNFDKAHIASLCKKIAGLARDGDQLSQHVFQQAGEDLARSITAVVKQAAPQLCNREGGVHVLCVGSVWLSWDLLKGGFETYLKECSGIDKMSLMKLTVQHGGIGAAYMAADHAEIQLKRDYSKNYSVFYRFERS